jgi:hypothetical protein
MRQNQSEYGNRGILKGLSIGLLSIVPTPLILFISTANSLYLGNQDDLDHQLGVMFPFLEWFLVMLLIGFLLSLVAKRGPGKIALWSYYLVGLFFLAFSFLRGVMTSVMDSPVALVVFVFLLALSTILSYKKLNLTRARKIFAVFGLTLLIGECVIFATKFENAPSMSINLSESRRPTVVGEKMPNVYHIVLDEYQTDLFDLTKTPEVEEGLAGFIYFPEATTIFGRTTMSLAAVFSGKSYDYQTSQPDYWYVAYNTSGSFLHWLIEADYETYAFIHKPSHMFEQQYFHHRIPHAEFVERRFLVDQQRMFNNLWFYRHLPIFISSRLIPREELDDLKGQKLLPKSAPLLSYSSFRKFLDVEKNLSPFSRYTFLHLLVPHFPNIFHAD